MSKNSNGYIIFYTVALTVICGSLLAFTSEFLKEYKEANIAYDTKKNILRTTLSLDGKEKEEIEKMYSTLVLNTYVVNSKGEKVEIDFDKVTVESEYSKAVEDRLLPVYELADASAPDQVAYYVLPMWGFGLWDFIWGWVALENDLNTIKGTVFQHRGETPGLGARITEEGIQDRFVGKKIYENDELVAVTMQKGEGNDYEGDPHKVDGMSGATITGQGLNDMLANYFSAYQSFFERQENTALLLNK